MSHISWSSYIFYTLRCDVNAVSNFSDFHSATCWHDIMKFDRLLQAGGLCAFHQRRMSRRASISDCSHRSYKSHSTHLWSLHTLFQRKNKSNRCIFLLFSRGCKNVHICPHSTDSKQNYWMNISVTLKWVICVVLMIKSMPIACVNYDVDVLNTINYVVRVKWKCFDKHRCQNKIKKQLCNCNLTYTNIYKHINYDAYERVNTANSIRRKRTLQEEWINYTVDARIVETTARNYVTYVGPRCSVYIGHTWHWYWLNISRIREQVNTCTQRVYTNTRAPSSCVTYLDQSVYWC